MSFDKRNSSTSLQLIDRSELRNILATQFSLDELKDLSFDLGVDYEEFPHSSKKSYCRELILYFERRGNLSELIRTALRYRPEPTLVNMLVKLPPSDSERDKVQIILPIEKFGKKTEIEVRTGIANFLSISSEDIMIIAIAPGSIKLLVGLPAESAERLVEADPNSLFEGKYPVAEIKYFKDLDEETKKDWRKTIFQKEVHSSSPIASLFSVLYKVLGTLVLIGAIIAIVLLLDRRINSNDVTTDKTLTPLTLYTNIPTTITPTSNSTSAPAKSSSTSVQIRRTPSAPSGASNQNSAKLPDNFTESSTDPKT